MDAMDGILTGGKRRYHIESVAGSNELGTVYKAFARRRVGERIKRRYYAILECVEGISVADVDNAVSASMMTMPYDVFEAERFELGGRNYIVLAKGVAPRRRNTRWQSLQNHGYLMLLLAALIFILMIVRFFQSPADRSESLPPIDATADQIVEE